MELPDLLDQVRSLSEQIGARTVYAEPVVAGDTTVVPVANVAYGFGGGFGKEGESDQKQGGGGGAGFRGKPAGYIEITPAGTRFVPTGEGRRIAAALLIGMVIGYLAGKTRKRRATEES